MTCSKTMMAPATPDISTPVKSSGRTTPPVALPAGAAAPALCSRAGSFANAFSTEAAWSGCRFASADSASLRVHPWSLMTVSQNFVTTGLQHCSVHRCIEHDCITNPCKEEGKGRSTPAYCEGQQEGSEEHGGGQQYDHGRVLKQADQRPLQAQQRVKVHLPEVVPDRCRRRSSRCWRRLCRNLWWWRLCSWHACFLSSRSMLRWFSFLRSALAGCICGPLLRLCSSLRSLTPPRKAPL